MADVKRCDRDGCDETYSEHKLGVFVLDQGEFGSGGPRLGRRRTIDLCSAACLLRVASDLEDQARARERYASALLVPTARMRSGADGDGSSQVLD